MKLTHFGILALLLVILSIPTYAVSEQVYVFYLSNETPVVYVGGTTNTTCRTVFPIFTLPSATTTTLKPFIIPKITLPSTTTTTRKAIIPFIIPKITLPSTTTTTVRPVIPIFLPIFQQAASTTTTLPAPATTTAIRFVFITLPAATTAAAATTTTALKLPLFITLPAATSTTAKQAATTTLNIPHFTLPLISTTTTLPKTLQKTRVNNNLVSMDKYSFVNCQCMPTTYEYTVKNTGNFTETYTFSVEPFPKTYYFFDRSFAVLGPNESVTAHLSLVLPCDMVGSYEAALVSTAKYSRQQTKVYFYLKTLKCHNYSVSIGQMGNNTGFTSLDKVDLCPGEEKSLTVQVQNYGDYLNIYRLSLDDASLAWASLSSNALVAVPARSTGYAELNLTPKKEGSYSLSLEAKPSLGTDMKTASLSAKVGKCYGYRVSLEKDYDKVCCGQYRQYNLTLKNTGTFTETYNLEVIKPGWAQLSQNLIEVEPNSTATVQLQMNVPCNTTSAKILVNSSNSDNTSVVSEMSLGIIPSQDCYQLYFPDKQQTTYYGYTTVPFTVKNTGSDWASYSILGIEGIGDWSYPITEALNLSAGEKAKLWIATNATPDISRGYYPFKVYIETSTGQQYSEDLVMKLSENNHIWNEFKRMLTWIESDLGRMQKKFFPAKTDAMLYHEWKMNTEYEVNLSTLFYDPDMDLLTFTTSGTVHIAAQVSNLTLTLTPEQDWTGTEKIQITADDGKGGVVTTPDITLNVVA